MSWIVIWGKHYQYYPTRAMARDLVKTLIETGTHAQYFRSTRRPSEFGWFRNGRYWEMR